MTVIIILTGRLGSGKTTILNNILRTRPANKKIEVIINELSPLNVDKSLLSSPYQVTEISNGCTCCTKSEDLRKAILSSKQARNPDMILIETTGVANPDNFVSGLGLEDPYHAIIVLIIDLYKFAETKGFGKSVANNIKNANIIILSKADLVSKDVVEKALVSLKKIGSHAKIITSRNGSISFGDIQVTGRSLRKNIEKKNALKEIFFYLFPELKNQHKSTTKVFSFETKSSINKHKLEAFISKLPKGIDRAKGIIKTGDGSIKFNYAVGLLRMEDSLEQAETSKIVIIGKMGFADKLFYMKSFWDMKEERLKPLPEVYANLKLLFA